MVAYSLVRLDSFEKWLLGTALLPKKEKSRVNPRIYAKERHMMVVQCKFQIVWHESFSDLKKWLLLGFCILYLGGLEYLGLL